MRRNRVVWRSSPELALWGRPRRRRGRFRRATRTLAVLTVLAVMRVAGNPRWRCAVLGAALTLPGLLNRDLVGNVILLPGLMILFYAPLLPGETPEERRRQRRLRRELAAYSTPAERRDLEALLGQYPDQETSELRAILVDQEQDVARSRYRLPGTGPA